MITADVVYHSHDQHYFIEASELGWPPGKWEQTIDTDMGNKLPFELVRTNALKKEVISVLYKQQLGCMTLSVMND